MPNSWPLSRLLVVEEKQAPMYWGPWKQGFGFSIPEILPSGCIHASSVFLEKVTQPARCAAYLGPAAVFPSPPGSSTLRLLWTSSKHTPGLGVGGGVVTLTRWQSSNSTQCFFLHPQTQKNSSLNYKCLLGGGHFLNALKYPIAADCY